MADHVSNLGSVNIDLSVLLCTGQLIFSLLAPSSCPADRLLVLSKPSETTLKPPAFAMDVQVNMN